MPQVMGVQCQCIWPRLYFSSLLEATYAISYGCTMSMASFVFFLLSYLFGDVEEENEEEEAEGAGASDEGDRSRRQHRIGSDGAK